jgi:hypothetical protein
MIWKPRHVSDDVLVLMVGGELSPRHARRARRHMGSCSPCRRRLTEFETTLASLRDDVRSASAFPLPPAAAARDRLKRRLAAYVERRQTFLRGLDLQVPLPRARWLYASVVLVLAAYAGVFHSQPPPRVSLANQNPGTLAPVPRRDLTPGVAEPVALEQVCGPSRAGRTAPVPLVVHRHVFERYGADYRRAAEYELDYLITPELGGVPDARNLWPQPFAGTPWNAYVKDELERLLHRRVCDGALDLAEAQREMAGDWISAYKRHFQTEEPLRDYARSPLTAGDGEVLRAELEELGLFPPADTGGPALLAIWQTARTDSIGRFSRTTLAAHGSRGLH